MNRSSAVHTFILKRMIQLLEEGGWCQHVMAQDQDGNPCYLEDGGAWYFGLLGAFYWVRDKYPQAAKHDKDALLAIVKALNKRNAAEGKIKSPSDILKDRVVKTDEWKYHFNKFNDEPGRTKMEVVRLLKEAMEN
jgi:hypothetical protein